MYVTLGLYLDRLKLMERNKPREQQRRIPSMEELAKAVGVHPVTMSNIANSNIRQLNLETGGRIISTLRGYGFPMEISDLLEYREADESAEG